MVLEGIPPATDRCHALHMAAHTAEDEGVCPQCQKRTLLTAVIQEVGAALAPPDRHEHPEFQICPVCGWNNLPERWGQQR